MPPLPSPLELEHSAGPCTWRHRLAFRSSCGFRRCVAKGSGTYTDLPADPTHRAAFHEIGAGWLGNDPIGMTERRASSKRYKNVTSTTQGQTDFYTSALCAIPQPTDSLGNSNYSHDRQGAPSECALSTN
ncbi:hypothetical protein Bbelb_039160 [Branchiostoma belcheri]|nr:hypothetical protein Bbelb_039160 [Branchiostoma belcheri]